MGFLSRILGGAKGRASEYQPSIVAHVAFGGAIRVIEAPVGKDWQHDEVEREDEGYTVMTLKYVLPASPSPLVLLAKIYTIKPGFELPEVPSSTDWRGVLDVLFAEISNVAVQATEQTTMRGTWLPASEAIIDGTGADTRAPLRIRERRAVLNEEQFIVTAMGTPEGFAVHATTIDNWFSTVAFVPISEEPEG